MAKQSLYMLLPAALLMTVEAVRQLRRRVLTAGLRFAGAQDSAFYLDTPDRLVLENLIFPFYQISREHHDILFVGCDWYTAGYARRFRLKRYATLDPSPSQARYGAQSHLVAPMCQLGAQHAANSLDVIVCNGIVGWGINDPRDAEASFTAAFDALRPGGHLIIGWNDVEKRRPFRLQDIAALNKFERLAFPPLGTDQHRVEHDMKHVFDFYVKPDTRS